MEELLRVEQEVERKLSTSIENLGERYTIWLKVKSERDDWKEERDTACLIEENLSVFIGTFCFQVKY